ncbi:MAG TPA: Wzz/FepE/Etk N-terminal domain-containing protein, partial [Pedobacter sp.]
MKSEKIIYLPSSPAEETEAKNFRTIVSSYLYHWPMFLVCLGLAFGIAFLYTQSLKSVHQVTAKITIKDEKSQASEKDAALQQLNISSQPKLIESEIETIRSRPIIGNLVKELELWVSYVETQRFKEV